MALCSVNCRNPDCNSLIVIAISPEDLATQEDMLEIECPRCHYKDKITLDDLSEADRRSLNEQKDRSDDFSLKNGYIFDNGRSIDDALAEVERQFSEARKAVDVGVGGAPGMGDFAKKVRNLRVKSIITDTASDVYDRMISNSSNDNGTNSSIDDGSESRVTLPNNFNDARRTTNDAIETIMKDPDIRNVMRDIARECIKARKRVGKKWATKKELTKTVNSVFNERYALKFELRDDLNEVIENGDFQSLLERFV